MAKQGMDSMTGNLRDMEISPGDAVNVSDTKMLSGLAQDTISYTEDNSTSEYTTDGKVPGPYGATGRH